MIRCQYRCRCRPQPVVPLRALLMPLRPPLVPTQLPLVPPLWLVVPAPPTGHTAPRCKLCRPICWSFQSFHRSHGPRLSEMPPHPLIIPIPPAVHTAPAATHLPCTLVVCTALAASWPPETFATPRQWSGAHRDGQNASPGLRHGQ